jgi:hypothetical protein
VAGIWGSIDINQWDFAAANVTCRQEGYSAGAEMVIHGATSVFTIDRGSAEWIHSIQCSGLETSLNQCNFTIDFERYASKDGGVVCSTNQSGEKNLMADLH